MQLIEKQTFEYSDHRKPGFVLRDAQVQRCQFIRCFLGFRPITRTTLKRRPLIQNVTFRNCYARGCMIDGAILDEVTVDTLRAPNWLDLFACAFRHVVFRGKIRGYVILHHAGLSGHNSPHQPLFDQANDAFHAKVDWALDISQGEFTEFCIRNLPPHLVRRDPDTQIVVTSDRVRANPGCEERKDIPGLWRIYLKDLQRLEKGRSILIAPKLGKDFKELHAGLKRLRKLGLAEPD